MDRHTRMHPSIPLFSLAFLIGACATGQASPAPATQPPATQAPATQAPTPEAPTVVQATLRLDWVPTGYHAPFFLALERGYYRDAGIELDVLDGQGSGTAIQLVGAGTETFGLASLSTMTLAVGEGAPVQAIAGMLERMPEAIISIAGSGITEPKDVEGKRMAYTAGSSGEVLFPAFAAANGIDESTVVQVTMEPAAKLTSLLTGSTDFTVDWPFTRGPIIEAQGQQAEYIYYADHGVNVLGHGLVASRDTITERPDLVRAFVAASLRGIDEAVADPEAAIDAMIKHRPDISDQRDVQLGQLQGLGDHLHTPNTAGMPTGLMAEADWSETIRLLTDYMELKGDPAASELFTNEFVPGS
jgi:NitT/TauT family transport system substrate-binding protein